MKVFKLVLIFTLCFASNWVFSQNPKVDSLKNLLNTSNEDENKVRILNEISGEYKFIDPKIMLQYAEKALQLSNELKFKKGEANANLNLGNYNIITGDYPAALQNFSSAQIIFEQELENNSDANNDLKNGLARAYASIGIVFSEQSSYAKALTYDLKALKIYEAINNLDRSARLYNNIGIVYKALNENDKALEFFTKCLKNQQDSKDENIGITLTNIGNIYLLEKNYSKANINYLKAQEMFVKYPNPRGLGELYNNQGRYFKKTNDVVKALESFEKAIVQFNAIEDKFGISDTYFYMGEIYLEQNDLNKALTYTTKSLELSKELEVKDQIVNCEKRISEIYERLNNPIESLKHFKLYANAKDSLANENNYRSSIRAEMNFEFEKKEVLALKEREKRDLIINEELKQHNLQIVFSVLFALAIFGIVFLIYSRMQLKKTLTLQKELAEYEQKALHLQMNPHFVFNCLGSISSFIVQNGTDSAIKYLSKFSKLMRLTLEYSKETLIPIDKEIESLQNYLELEQLRFNHKFDFTISKSEEIDDDTALPPLLLQPFVENAIIHGLIPKEEKGLIEIEFSLSKSSLKCIIKDDGIGFEKSKELKKALVSVHKSMALDITRKRLEMMESSTTQKANVEIIELKNEKLEITGTMVVLNLPIQYIVKSNSN